MALFGRERPSYPEAAVARWAVADDHATHEVPALTVDADDAPESASDAPEHFTPRGTIFLLVCYVAVIILLWISVYLILLSRGVTV